LGEFLKNHFFLSVLVVTAVAGLDQISKNLIVRTLVEGQQIPLIDGLFNLTLSYNRGAAFGFLANIESDTLRISLLWSATILALGAVIFMFFFEYKGNTKGQLALALILGGALGNIIDRVSLGEVVDFLDFYYRSYHWPAFNFADSAICSGVTLLLLPKLNFFSKKLHPNIENSGVEGSKFSDETSDVSKTTQSVASNLNDNSENLNTSNLQSEIKNA
jgi:signal peptidase II